MINTYKAVETWPGSWDIHWLADGVSVGLLGRADGTEAEVMFAVYRLARAEIAPARDA